MSNRFTKMVGTSLVGALSIGAGFAQGAGWYECIDPCNTQPYSPDFGSSTILNDLFGATVGISGTVTYGGQLSPCFVNPLTINVAGRVGFMIGNQGSSQSGFDDLMNLTWGMPIEPGGSWSTMQYTIDGGTPIIYGANGLSVAFTGDSDRYIYTEFDDNTNNVVVTMRTDVVGDAARVQWELQNTDTANPSHTIGVNFGQWVAMLNQANVSSGAPWFGGPTRGNYVVVPGDKPLVHNLGSRQIRWIRSQDAAAFPPYVRFDFSQRDAYGMQVDTGPTQWTSDAQGNNSDATPMDEFALGDALFLLGAYPNINNPFPDVILPDSSTVDTAYIAKWYPVTVPSNARRRIVFWTHSTSGYSNLSLPYAVVADGPRLIATDDTTPSGLANNPFTIRVYVDNTGGFSDVGQETPLNDVEVTLTLPTGLSLTPGQQATKTISQINPQAVASIDFEVEADGVEFGPLEYSVRVRPIPGPVKTVKGSINVSATPRIRLQPAANLVSIPFTFPDTSLEVVLGLNQPTDFQAYEWDPQQKGYVVATSVPRGKGFWLIYNGGTELSQQLAGSPSLPTDISTGAQNIQLKSGWNLIGNPYPYSFELGQIVGVSAANPNQSFRWRDLVNQGVVSSFVAYWDPITQTYKFLSDPASLVAPNRGYWVYVNTAQDLTLNFPPIFAEFLPQGVRATTWVQSAKQWKVNLVARTNKGLDDQNAVGVADSAQNAKLLTAPEPPMAPTQDVAVSIDGTLNGQPTRLAQSMSGTAGRQEWKVVVENQSAGPVTVNWPNMTTVPKTVRLRLVDVATGATRDMRQTSGYTYTMSGAGTREFKVQMEPGSDIGAAVIGNVVVAQAGRGLAHGSNPVQINYTLSRAANTTIRVLSGSGKEIRSLRTGKAEQAGENQATWTLQDNANRQVPPGTYKVEILAETSSGERVRRFAVVNVVRG